MNKFSIIVPCYNTKIEYFIQCVNSIINQTYDNFEVIIVDDGSTEENVRIYQETIEKDKRFTVISQKNQGVSVSRNRGIEESKGDYIIFIDSDDYVQCDMLEKINNIISSYENNELCDLVIFEHMEWNNKIKEMYIKVLDEEDKINIIQQLMDENNWLSCGGELNHFGSVWNKCYRKSFIVQNKIELESGIRYCEDVLFSIKSIYMSKKTVYTNYKLYNYRIYGNSTFDKYNENADKDFIKFIYKLKSLLLELRLYDKLKEAYIMKIYTSYQFVMILQMFNKGNSESIKNNTKKWKSFKNNEEIKEMINKINIMKLNLKGKIVIFSARKNLYFLTGLIYRIKNNLR